MLYNRFACPLPFIHHCNMTRVNIWPWLLSSLLLSSSSPLDNPTRIDQSTTPFQLPMTFIVRLRSRWTEKRRCSVLDGTPSRPLTGRRRGVRRRLVATFSNKAADGAKEKVINKMFLSTKSTAHQLSLRPLRGSLPRPRPLPISCPCQSPRHGLSSRHRPLDGNSRRPPHPEAQSCILASVGSSTAPRFPCLTPPVSAPPPAIGAPSAGLPGQGSSYIIRGHAVHAALCDRFYIVKTSTSLLMYPSGYYCY